MASKRTMKPLQRLAYCKTAPSFTATAARRTIYTSHDPATLHQACAQIKPTLSRPILQHSFRRSYADAVAPKTKTRGKKFLRWTWRLTYLSAIGGIVYMGYGIYLLRTPQEQLEADPTKKTLVILGIVFHFQLHWQPLTLFRHGLGSRLSAQEARHGKLQCHRHLAAKFLSLHSATTIMYDWYDRASIYHGAYQEYSAP